ncbi:MAG TPA: hypothetical protein VE173_05875 [Longimicrobiales bacterium]|nr:hypothetical protein [Longimicrobiales bacterium]
MWETNKDIRFVYATNGTQAFWAMLDGLAGWKRVRTGSPDGVANVAQVLSTAKLHGRKVNVFLSGDLIERAVML